MSALTGPRLLRAAVFTAVCVVLSALGHVLAACEAVPWWTLSAGFAAVFVLALPFTGRERSLPAITAALVAGQLALHTVFGVGQQHAAASVAADATGSGGDALIRAAARLVCGAGAAQLSPGEAHRIITAAGLDPERAVAAAAPAAGTVAAAAPQAAATLPSLAMLLGHLLAALATGWLLRHGDLALLRLARLAHMSARGAAEVAAEGLVRSLRAALVLVRLLACAAHTAPNAVLRAPHGDDDIPLPMAADALHHTVIRRGPPAVYHLAA
ncbi:hypothetical protein BJP40_08140 [Streptomyces sp. CC53]|uniref:hypothetical protein n=1 Tax=unclassified Streptomyces TaxID=2593676 RepID=UPI0008DE2FC4|nr:MULTISPECIES: hypothetical protein [unclassified Streptomyces]OII60827.1 hypothetical protein BJP40_08140 [Streptomyces sp. CC53]